MTNDADARWRLVLGGPDADGFDGDTQRVDAALAWLYERSRPGASTGPEGRADLSVPAWLALVRDVFPSAAQLALERDALERHGLLEVASDPDVLRRATPTWDLARALLRLRPLLPPAVLGEVRRLVERAVASLRQDLEDRLTQRLAWRPASGKQARNGSSHAIDLRSTVARSLRFWDGRRLMAADLRFRPARGVRHRVIVALDQSASMADALVEGAILASVMCRVPALDVRLLLWDDRVVDVSEWAADPVDVLFSAQLGGGTDLGRALEAIDNLVEVPDRTLVVVISDFDIGPGRASALRKAADLRARGTMCVGTAVGDASMDQGVIQALVDAGWAAGNTDAADLAGTVGELLRGARRPVGTRLRRLRHGRTAC